MTPMLVFLCGRGHNIPYFDDDFADSLRNWKHMLLYGESTMTINES